MTPSYCHACSILHQLTVLHRVLPPCQCACSFWHLDNCQDFHVLEPAILLHHCILSWLAITCGILHLCSSWEGSPTQIGVGARVTRERCPMDREPARAVIQCSHGPARIGEARWCKTGPNGGVFCWWPGDPAGGLSRGLGRGLGQNSEVCA